MHRQTVELRFGRFVEGNTPDSFSDTLFMMPPYFFSRWPYALVAYSPFSTMTFAGT